MSLNISLSGIKNSLIAAYQTAAAKASEWMGRIVVVVKSKTETALPYLQDKRIATVSLVAVNLILFEIGKFFVLLRHTRVKGGGDLAVIAAVVTVGVTGFVKYTKIPFSPLVIASISAIIFVVRLAIEANSNSKSKSKRKIEDTAQFALSQNSTNNNKKTKAYTL